MNHYTIELFSAILVWGRKLSTLKWMLLFTLCAHHFNKERAIIVYRFQKSPGWKTLISLTNK